MNQVVAIVGMCGTGKSVATDCLENNGWRKVYFGGIILEALRERGLEITPENERIVREELRAIHGNAAHALKFLPIIMQLLEEYNVVIDGLYSWSEYKYLKKELKNRLHVLCIVSDKLDRYNRLAKRPVRPLSFSEAEERDIAEIENMEKGGPIAIADKYIMNNSTERALEYNVLTYVSNLDS